MQKHSLASLAPAIVAAIVVASAPALAHHGWGGQSETESTLTGTLESPVSLAGPHGTLKLKTADGQVWDITMAPPTMVSSSGLREGLIPVGATITVKGHRNKDPKRFEMKTESVTWNNRTFDYYPNRH